MPPLLIITMMDFRIFLSAMGRGSTVGPYLLYRNNGNSNGWLKVVLRGTRAIEAGLVPKFVWAGGKRNLENTLDNIICRRIIFRSILD